MSQPPPVTAIVFDGATFFCNRPREEVVEALANAKPLVCWWFDGLGVRYEETFHYFGDPLYVRTESDRS